MLKLLNEIKIYELLIKQITFVESLTKDLYPTFYLGCSFVHILGPLSAHIFRKSAKIRIFENFQNLDSLIKIRFFALIFNVRIDPHFSPKPDFIVFVTFKIFSNFYSAYFHTLR